MCEKRVGPGHTVRCTGRLLVCNSVNKLKIKYDTLVPNDDRHEIEIMTRRPKRNITGLLCYIKRRKPGSIRSSIVLKGIIPFFILVSIGTNTIYQLFPSQQEQKLIIRQSPTQILLESPSLSKLKSKPILVNDIQIYRIQNNNDNQNQNQNQNQTQLDPTMTINNNNNNNNQDTTSDSDTNTEGDNNKSVVTGIDSANETDLGNWSSSNHGCASDCLNPININSYLTSFLFSSQQNRRTKRRSSATASSNDSTKKCHGESAPHHSCALKDDERVIVEQANKMDDRSIIIQQQPQQQQQPPAVTTFMETFVASFPPSPSPSHSPPVPVQGAPHYPSSSLSVWPPPLS